jgi:hypothetical protein
MMDVPDLIAFVQISLALLLGLLIWRLLVAVENARNDIHRQWSARSKRSQQRDDHEKAQQEDNKQ